MQAAQKSHTTIQEKIQALNDQVASPSHPKLETLNPKPETLNPEPCTLNPEP